MADVIRQDVVQVEFDINSSPLEKLNKDMESLKKMLGGSLGKDTFSDMEKDAKKASESVKDIDESAKKTKKTLKDIANTGLEKLKSGLKKVGTHLSTIAKKAGGAAYNGLKKLAGISFKTLAVGITGAATAIGGLVAKSVSAYADYEQLKGGMETLLGAKGAKTVEEYAKLTGKSVGAIKGEYDKLVESEKLVMSNANNAFKTAGMSANQYMETITSFSAALKTSLGGDALKAAKLADTAIQDMADNANKMGTPLESVSIVYSNLARGMYMTLDNLKLGYAGSKEGAKQLVNDAAKIDKSVKANDLSYANLVKAIHAVQVKMDIYGTTSKEAFGTITGSMNMFKSAWGNLMPALIQGGDAFDQCVNNLVDSIVGFKDEATGEIKGGIINNLMPAIEKALEGVGTLIDRLAPIISEHFPVLAEKLIPPLITAAIKIVDGLIKALPTIVKTIFTTLADICGEQFPTLKSFFSVFANNSGSIAKFIPILLGLVGAFMAFKKVHSVVSTISGLFGKSKGGEGDGSGGGLFNSLAKFAKTKPTLILKGMANLAIVLGGLTILGAAMAAVAPYIAKLSDAKSMFELVSIIAVLGIVGTALAKMGEICGKIKVVTVVKGLANMAIMLGGMTALFLLIGATSLLDFDYSKILKISLIIGALGTVGAVLSVFAGIVGLIPIPIVLAGLANMALVIGGMTALIVAFGKLSQIEGFNDFITNGGATLANLVGQIGKIAGSLVGGLAEGVTDHLPKIGENLAGFATSLKPMFTMFKGADMSGIGSFFKSMGSFMLSMAGEGILSIFSGGINFGELGTGLKTFAESSEGFFKKVAELPENGFANATKLFDCLAGMKSLPKEGGVVGWFSGGIDYTKIANGLKQLSSTSVIDFFHAVSELQQTGFDNATKLFDCLAGMKSLPKEGGVRGWFTGDIDYSKIASGLGSLSSEGVRSFFEMVGGLNPQTFENTKALFNALASIKELPTDGGWWDKLKGEETSTLSNIAKELGNFGEKTATFFKQVNSLNVTKLNSLWKSLEDAGKLTTENLSGVIGDSISSLVTKISELPKKMGDALKKNSGGLSDGVKSMWKDAVKAAVAPVNKLISGANHLLSQFGSSKKVISWTPYAKGTDGHKGGNALVNDGRGAELVQMPNGKMFIPQGKNVFIPNAPKGMKVLSAEHTAQLMGRKSPTYKYADGIGNIDVWKYFDNPSGLITKLTDNISYGGMSGFASSLGKGMVKTVSVEMVSWVKKLFEESTPKINYVATKGVEQWRTLVEWALKKTGQYSAANVQRTLYQMQTESGGNPNAINLWDSNAKKGIPSKGLMQVIEPTFKAYAAKGYDKNVYDPASNILASINYAVARYGSLERAYRGTGYANGGFANRPSIFGEDGLEAAIPLTARRRKRGIELWHKTGEMLGVTTRTPEGDTAAYSRIQKTEKNEYSPVFNFNINGGSDTRATARAVKKAAKEALQEMIESMERRSPKLQEV